MQFNRDLSGHMAPLPKPSVDTGSGLERVSAVLQGVYSNYGTDCFEPLIQAISRGIQLPYGEEPARDVSFHVLADHLRAATFLIADGVIPSNEGRGYVLRRILRRAIRHGKKLNQEQPFLFNYIGELTRQMGGTYPEIKQNQKLIETLIKEEESKFHETLHRGLGLHEGTIRRLRRRDSRYCRETSRLSYMTRLDSPSIWSTLSAPNKTLKSITPNLNRR